MAHLANSSGYHMFVERLNKFPQGAPPSELLYKILKLLLSEREARLVSLLPIKIFGPEKASRAWELDLTTTRKILDDLCSRALLVDFVQNGRTLYCLPPPMAGFFEFSMMRLRSDIDQKALAELYYQYVNVEEDFAMALFGEGSTQLGRVFVNEAQLSPEYQLEVLDYERASYIIRSAKPIGVSQCYCRHKMSHLDRACNAPQHICMTLNHVAGSLIRHGHARRVDVVEAMDLLDKAYGHNLVQFGENVRQEVSFICHCCKCCCEGMIAARRFALFHPVATSNFIPQLAQTQCSGCGKCTKVCPVEAIGLQSTASGDNLGSKAAQIDASVCLGCGLCARVCPTGAMAMVSRPQRVITPMNTAHRVVLMAIERGKLQHVLFDNQVLFSHKALATMLGVILKLPPVKQALAAKQLRSRYLETLIQRMNWQPEIGTATSSAQPMKEGNELCSISR